MQSKTIVRCSAAAGATLSVDADLCRVPTELDGHWAVQYYSGEQHHRDRGDREVNGARVETGERDEETGEDDEGMRQRTLG